jgi:YihY family inner membrane protein
MNLVQKAVNRLDRAQQSSHFPGFLVAVIKKYGDDQAGYQAALLTYYGFLALFPLLLVLTTLAGILASHHPDIQHDIVKSVTTYFPVLGDQLSSHIQSLHESGVALAVGLLFTLYGARGVAAAFRHGINHIWQVPHEKRDNMPKSALKNLSIIVIGGVGLIVASISTAAAAGAGHGFGFRALSILVNIFVLFWLFFVLLRISLPRPVHLKDIRLGAAVAAVSLVILQALGGYLLSRELKNLDALYSSFAIPLSMLFWIYLQAQTLYYSAEIAVVHKEKLWPRSLGGELTTADKRVYRRQAAKEQMVEEEQIDTSFGHYKE